MCLASLVCIFSFVIVKNIQLFIKCLCQSSMALLKVVRLSYLVPSVGRLVDQPFQNSIEISFFFGTDSIAANFAVRYGLHI